MMRLVVAILRIERSLIPATFGNIGHIMPMSRNTTMFLYVMPQQEWMEEDLSVSKDRFGTTANHGQHCR
ncbi:MAG TPA: hypothetical protein DEF45_10245 [Rhodopirellula sp.]|nr:hypothetical protein [Rhodopirellula sp.]